MRFLTVRRSFRLTATSPFNPLDDGGRANVAQAVRLRDAWNIDERFWALESEMIALSGLTERPRATGLLRPSLPAHRGKPRLAR